MEMILVSLSFTTLLAFFFLKYILHRTATSKGNLPPYPWRLPVIGNLHQLSLYPHRSLRSLSRRHGPLMLLHFGSVPVLIVSSAEVAHEVMKTHDLKFANRPIGKATIKFLKGGRNLLLSPYGEYWRQMKSLCVLHLLSNKMVRSIEKLREEELNMMMEKLEKASSSSSSVNLSETIFNMVNTVVSRVALGKKYSGEKSIANLKKMMRAVMDIAIVFPVGDYIPCLAWTDTIRGLDHKLEKINKSVYEFLENVVREHEDEGGNKEKPDFVDMLLWIQKEKPNGFEIDRQDIKLIIWDIFIAGTTTTSTLLEWTMTELIRHPEIMKKLQEDIRTHSRSNSYVNEEDIGNMKYLKAVIKEILRIHPSAPILIPRQLSEDVKLKGYDIAAGTQVIINAWAIQRDSATWGSDAEEFKPERHLDSALDFQGQNFMYIPFGSGRRLCPGIGFAMALAEVTLANLVNRFNWKFEARTEGDDDQYHLAEAFGIEVCRKFPLIAFPSSL
uniref:Cytochrome P450 71A15 n=1 Tax=Noccaea caerulescens TaxID=107243 RepID=A0A1J3K526_NOCCA